VKRREFTNGIIGLVGALSLAEWEQLVRPSGDDDNPDDLESLSHGSLRLRPGRINPEEVTGLERMVRTFERWDAQSGGARWRKAVVGQLRSVVDLLDDELQCEPSVRQRLLIVTAQLAQLSGWTAYDSRLYRSAHRYYALGLQASDRANSHPLAAKITGDMALLANAVGRHDDELRLVSEALATLPAQVPVTVQPELLGLQARAYARLGREAESQRAMETCINVFAGAKHGDERPHYLDQAEVDCMAANAYIELALHSTPRSQLSAYTHHAEGHALRALADRNPAYVRSRVLDTIRLAYVRLIQRDPAEAVAVAAQALDLASDVSSARVLERMVQFNKELHDRLPSAPAAHQFEERLREHLGQRDDIST
jgi:tetratricopeptide (TPR) repeat protein